MASCLSASSEGGCCAHSGAPRASKIELAAQRVEGQPIALVIRWHALMRFFTDLFTNCAPWAEVCGARPIRNCSALQVERPVARVIRMIAPHPGVFSQEYENRRV